MKFLLHWLVLSASVWLAGCANPALAPTDTPASSSVGAPVSGSTSTSANDSNPALYPAGGLKPLTSLHLGSQSVHAVLPPADLWERVRRGFAMPDLDTDLVRERELWYSSRPDYMARMTERGSKYLFYIVEELERRDMPSELALLPFIESAFNPQAISSAKAAGMWQFMPATGKHFDLKQNMFRDDRRDVIESTRAALDYMQKLYGMFGDWHLALAAYNWGEGSVQRAIKKAKKAGTGTGYTDLVMPMETRFYVPKLQAVKNIVANPESFRVTLPEIGNHPYFQSVEITHDIDVSLAASLAEVPLDDFRALNPSASKPVLLAAGTSQILLPWDNAERFQSNLEAYTGGRLTNWTAWIAPTTLKPADAAKRVGMTEAELLSVNQIPPRMRIRAGSTLLVRRSASIDSDVTEHVADNGYLSLAPDVVLRKTVVKAGKRDNVASMARRFSVSAQVLADWNKVSTSATFRLGQSVVLYLPAKARAGRGAKARGKTAVARAAKRAPVKSAARKKPVKLARQ
ncbi:transglycosylase SLT domain-containing protein [Rhodoferax sp.]|uniref:transglycosylase SLT domain-containing protein n=1 Tax=Rhodoferax sp. TaxID=50421 RepID=UPI002613846C|nr:transglycosylase SLT domain-containing protein [Rhodoferax sp.]MDD2919453.1 transglycosylase SLT domain-containing protein [Rhodoferax sp.]